ncbi:IclR family transcriptional regulator [Streptomyces sp. NPDC056656]|uniref:IclR family transcriptional regulator n=1 Tax=Streptomyces sp. NPDC056656 TaxID=3345895 RepID=UPI0036936241
MTVQGAERTVLGRAADIMAAFNDGRQVLSLGDLCERTRLPKSTLHRLADQLCGVGWIERDPGGYRVGLRMFELGNLAATGSRLQEAALPHLQALSARTGMAAQLGVLDRAEVVYLERVTAGPLRLPTRRGGRKPAHCTALGKALSAFDDDAVDGVLDAPMPRRTERTITDPLQLRSELQQVRELGVAFDRGEGYEGLGCVAVPVHDGDRVVAAVSVTGPLGQLRWAALAEAVQGTAAAVRNANRRVGVPGQRRTQPSLCQ